MAFSRRPQGDGARKTETDEEALGLARGGRFAVAVLCIMVAEQTLLNGGVLAADSTPPTPRSRATSSTRC